MGILQGHPADYRLGRVWLAISWFYILYFALGLPFICWGALATPGHPHRLPHFVFSDPPVVGHTLPTQATVVHAHHSGAQPAVPPLAQHNAEPQRPDPVDVAGQSVPALGVALLLLLLVVRAAIQGAPLYNFPRTIPFPLPNSYQAVIPTPPPRLLGA